MFDITPFNIPDILLNSELAQFYLSYANNFEKGSVEWVDMMSTKFTVKYICYTDKINNLEDFINVRNTYKFWGKKYPISLYAYGMINNNEVVRYLKNEFLNYFELDTDIEHLERGIIDKYSILEETKNQFGEINVDTVEKFFNKYEDIQGYDIYSLEYEIDEVNENGEYEKRTKIIKDAEINEKIKLINEIESFDYVVRYKDTVIDYLSTFDSKYSNEINELRRTSLYKIKNQTNFVEGYVRLETNIIGSMTDMTLINFSYPNLNPNQIIKFLNFHWVIEMDNLKFDKNGSPIDENGAVLDDSKLYLGTNNYIAFKKHQIYINEIYGHNGTNPIISLIYINDYNKKNVSSLFRKIYDDVSKCFINNFWIYRYPSNPELNQIAPIKGGEEMIYLGDNLWLPYKPFIGQLYDGFYWDGNGWEVKRFSNQNLRYGIWDQKEKIWKPKETGVILGVGNPFFMTN